MNPRPKHTPAEALERCRALVGKGQYLLGALDGDAARQVFDCTSFSMRYAFELAGKRLGFNRAWTEDWCTGTRASVVDHINSNSAIEDAMHERDLFEFVTGRPELGDLVVCPTIRLPDHPDKGPWIGHAAIVSGVDRSKHRWDPQAPQFALLDIIECRGPDGRSPAIRQTNGTYFDTWRQTWPKVNHRSWLLRVRA